MKKIFLLFLVFITIFSCGTNKKLNKTITDKKYDKKVLINECSRSGFLKDEFKEWFESAYNEYNPDENIIEMLKKIDLNEVKIMVIFGTWCGDSRREIPRFYKIIDKTKIKESNITFIGIDTKRSANHRFLDFIEFTRIPTFIFYKKGKELGRIVESTKVSLESDMYKILSN